MDQNELQYVIWEDEAFGDWQLKRSDGTAIAIVIIAPFWESALSDSALQELAECLQGMRKKKPEIDRLCGNSTEHPCREGSLCMRGVHDRQRIRSYGLEYFNDSVIQKRTNNPALAQHRDCLSSLFFAAS